MKKLIWCLVIICTTSATAYAQNWAYVDSQVILKHLPEYTAAEKQIKALADQWQKQLDGMNKEVERLTQSFQADQVLMTEDRKKIQQGQIAEKQRASKDFQFTKFGENGELAQQSNALMKPLQDRVAIAIQKVAEKDDLETIFDKSELSILFSNTRYDKTREVISQLGLVP